MSLHSSIKKMGFSPIYFSWHWNNSQNYQSFRTRNVSSPVSFLSANMLNDFEKQYTVFLLTKRFLRWENLQGKLSKCFSIFNNKYWLFNSQASRCWNSKNTVGSKSTKLELSTLSIKKKVKCSNLGNNFAFLSTMPQPTCFSFYYFLVSKFLLW